MEILQLEGMAKYKQDGKWESYWNGKGLGLRKQNKRGLDEPNARADVHFPASDCKRKLMKMAVA